MMSLQTTLASMFEPRGTPMEWNKHLNWQPIPIVSEPLDEDSVGFNISVLNSLI